MKKTDLALSLGQRLLLLLCVFIVCFLLTSAASYLIGRFMPGNSAGALRISSVLQDVLMFILPAVATALLVTRRPAELLGLMKRPTVWAPVSVVLILFVSVPAQEAVIYWNYNLEFPDAWQSFAEKARQMEDQAQGAMNLLLADTSYAALIVNLLIIGVLAGLSEELLFRGCLQRLLTTGGVNVHAAVWIVALCFSALHFQLYGFVPRMLLGAYFGYLLVWTGSLWTPVLAHVLNNMMFVISAWHQMRHGGIEALDSEPELWPVWTTVLSVIATAVALYFIYQLHTGLRGRSDQER